MKISKEEKAFIKAYVNLVQIKSPGFYNVNNCYLIEDDCTRIIDNRNIDYRNLVEYFIIDYIKSQKN